MTTASSGPCRGAASAPVDFSSLASQPLSSVDGFNYGNRQAWQMSLGELKDASVSAANSNDATATDAMARSVLGPNQEWTLENLRQLANDGGTGSRQRTGVLNNDEKAGSPQLSVHDELAKHQQSILDREMIKERFNTNLKSQKLVNNYMEEDWDRERSRCLMEVTGHQNRASLPAPSTPSIPRLASEIAYAIATPSVSYDQNLALIKDSSHGSSSMDSSLDFQTIQSHVELVAKLNRSSYSSRDVFSDFQRIASNESAPSLPQNSAYGIAWTLLQNMTCQPQVSPLSSAVGALTHYCRQFLAHATGRVRTAKLAGHDLYGTSGRSSYMRESVVKDYATLEVGTTSSPWPAVYFALRCGDANEALNIVTTHGDTIEPVVQRTLSQLAQIQSSSGCLWDAQLIPPIPRDDRRKLVDMYHRAKTHQSGDSYLLASLGLLSLAEPITSCDVVKTIEDYMFGVLWDAVQHERPAEELAKIGKVVREWGPGRFEETGDSGGWDYALPLLAVQCYRTSLLHLTQAGGSLGLLQATHLGLVLSHSGVGLTDLGQAEAPGGVLTTLLVSFANVLRPMDAPAALEYLVRIPENGRKRKEIALLIVESRQFELLGRIDSELKHGAHGSALSAHFPGTVSSLLADAADEAGNRGNFRDAAELLFLAGRYSALLTLLNRQLASQLKCSPSPEQTFWLQAATEFKSLHLTKGHTRVVEVLETENKLVLIDTLQLLMELMGFVDQLNKRDFESALSTIDSLGLLPISDDEVSVKLNQFNSRDVVVRDSFPIVLLGVMESLYEQHNRVKRSSQDYQSQSSASALQQRLGELRKRARLLVLFSGLCQISNAGDLNIRLAQMEAHMT